MSEEAGWLSSDVMSDDESRRLSAQSLGVPFVILGRDDISLEALSFIPEPISRKHNIVAYRIEDDSISVALLDIADLEAIDFLRTRQKIKPRLTNRDSMKQALLLYQKHLKEKFAGLLEKGVKAADSLLRHAIHSNATHIHLEPSAAVLLVRYRINGVLHEAMRLPERTGTYIVERLKALAKLFPMKTIQEGRFKIQHDDEVYTVGVSTVPVVSGEKMLLRLSRMHKDEQGFSLESLGFHGLGLEMVHDLLRKKTGVLVVAGPAESGKTTTLYTLIDHIGRAGSIASIEEKIEYRLPGVAQMQVRSEVGLDLIAGFRAVLRHDPDVVLISDLPTKSLAALAAQSGVRGVFIVAGMEVSSIDEVLQKFDPALPSAILTVRLVRKLCAHCRDIYNASREDLAVFEDPEAGRADFGRILAALKDEDVIDKAKGWKDLKFYKAVGCSKCREGYKGVVGLQEVIDENASSLSLVEDALFKAALGLTSLEEVVYLAQ